MKLFISWSGTTSQKIADAIDLWVRDVLQHVECFISDQKIEAGSRWHSVISEHLNGTSEGVVCVTPTNITSPWLNYEAGALSKAAGGGRVRTVLFGLNPLDIPGSSPLVHFQHSVITSKDDMRKFIDSINMEDGKATVELERLNRAFETHWLNFEESIRQITDSADEPSTPEPRSDSSMLSDVLQEVRGLSNSVQELRGQSLGRDIRGEQAPPNEWMHLRSRHPEYPIELPARIGQNGLIQLKGLSKIDVPGYLSLGAEVFSENFGRGIVAGPIDYAGDESYIPLDTDRGPLTTNVKSLSVYVPRYTLRDKKRDLKN